MNIKRAEKRRGAEIWAIGTAVIAFGLVMTVRSAASTVRMIHDFSLIAERAGILPSILAMIYPVLYLSLFIGGIWFLALDERGRVFLQLILAINLTACLFSIVRFWYLAPGAKIEPGLRSGTVVARSSMIPVYIVFLLEVAALYLLSRDTMKGKFRDFIQL